MLSVLKTPVKKSIKDYYYKNEIVTICHYPCKLAGLHLEIVSYIHEFI